MKVSEEPLIDPLGPDPGENRVIRGGSWDHDPANGRLALTPTPQPAAAQPAR